MTTVFRLTLSLSALLMANTAYAEMNFNRIASFPTSANNTDAGAESSAEILDITADGMTVIYTDSPLGVIGLIDITEPNAPKPLGTIDMGGEPTSVTVIGQVAYVAVNTSPSYTAPSGKLVAIDVPSKTILASCDLGGQPDSTAHTVSGDRIMVAIENERDEDFGDGRVGQMPAGFMVEVLLNQGALNCDQLRKIDVSGLAAIAGDDPEPEFIDINALGETVLTMQENNELVILGADGAILNHFSAGSVDLVNIDIEDEKAALDFTSSQMGRLREPDGVQWIDNDHFAIANEGDMDGGSRGFTVFNKDGTLVYESNSAFEHAVVEVGHYPDRRSDAKGVEPEGIEVATFGNTPFMFLLAERGSVVGVYDMSAPAMPKLKQILPSGISPEGAISVPARNLFLTANELDLSGDGGVRAHVMVYEYQDAAAVYPHITSQGAEELIGWGAMSGLVADTEKDGILYAVNDSFYGFQPTIFTIDTTQYPARITKALPITREGRAAQKLDIEGITLDGKGGFWLASEGRSDRLIPHALYYVNAKGQIKAEIPFPDALASMETRYGAEGITLVGDTLWIAIQREWKDDPKDTVKLLAYNIETGEWVGVRYPLTVAKTGWMGLSEIVAHGDYMYLIERDNQIGDAAKVKMVTRVAMEQMVPAVLGGDLPLVTPEVVRDLLPDLRATGGYVVDKVEGLAITKTGKAFVITDNDGVDDSSGETLFFTFDGL